MKNLSLASIIGAIIIIAAGLSLSACFIANPVEPVSANTVSKAHQLSKFQKKQAIRFDIELHFGGKKRLDATVTSLTNSGKIRLDKKDGTSLVFDGQQVWKAPAGVDYKSARFDIFTWQYFFMAPFKLKDPGTVWTVEESKPLKNEQYNAARLTFEAGTGDAPDDWYLLYIHPKTQLLHAMAYIVTMGKSVEKAEEEPHAITYENFSKIQGIPFATEWKFWDWSEENGLGKQLGNARITNIHFPEVDDNTFSLAKEKEEVKL